MKSQSRKFLRCMFCCSEEPVTAEHIFGASLSRRFADQYPARIARSALSPQRIEPAPAAQKEHFRGAGAYPLAFTSHSMCRTCNNELGEEISILTALLERFFKGKTNTIPADRAKLALRYFQRIGILVDLETSSFDPEIMTEDEKDIRANRHFGQTPPFLSKFDREMHRKGDILPAVKVFLGKHRGSHGRCYAMNVARFGDRGGPLQRKFIFSISHVTCLIIVGDANVNRNAKLQRFESEDSSFTLNIKNISTDSDVMLNYNPFTSYIDGSISVARI